MPIPIVAAGVVAIAVPLAIKVLVGLGVGVVTYVGADFAISEAQTFMNSKISGLPVDMISLMNLAGFDTGIKIIFSSWAAYISIRSTMGAFTRLKFTP